MAMTKEPASAHALSGIRATARTTRRPTPTKHAHRIAVSCSSRVDLNVHTRFLCQSKDGNSCIAQAELVSVRFEMVALHGFAHPVDRTPAPRAPCQATRAPRML